MRSEWNEIDRTFAAFEQLRQRLETPFAAAVGGPRLRVFEDDAAYRLEAELPGMSDKDIDVAMQGDVVTLRGERKLPKLEKYSTHRQERRPYAFSRSFTLGGKIDVERATATMKDGVLAVTLPRTPETAPRPIAVRAN